MTPPRPVLVGEGEAEPQGVQLLDDGTANVAVFSAHATAIELCVFDAHDSEVRVALPARSGDIWHGRVTGIGAGTRYGLRANGPWAPQSGHRFDAAKLLLDPFAAAIDRQFVLHPALFSANPGDSAAVMPKGIVLPEAAPAPERPPLVAWPHCFIYELHVRGFSMRHPDIPPALRGTFAALAHPAAIDHFRRLGVTTLEVMPASAWIDERHLPPLGLSNYWGYNPVSYLAPDPRLAPGGWADIRAATDALALAGIEVILDVVFNHSGEGDALGPTVSLRGLDNAAYYRMQANDPGAYVNDTGCGNTLALDRPQGVRLAMEAMRCWVRRGGVRGFRFDLATTLGRRADGFDPEAPLLTAIAQDPELRGLRLIAEPWDVGPGGYQLGRFPALWGEWNDRFRDDLRRFWGGGGTAGALATRLAGSADLFGPTRRPSRGINFATAHDGFTLADLVAYTAKRNAANGEDNRDGSNDNFSWNCGVEGPSAVPAVVAARQASQAALLASLILARGTPMLAMGSELGHSQAGNNNAYAQDNALAWLDWQASAPDFTGLIGDVWRLRQGQPALHSDHWLRDPTVPGSATSAVWHTANGEALSPAQWQDPRTRTLIVVLTPSESPELAVILVLHRGSEPVDVKLPPPPAGTAWRVALDTAGDRSDALAATVTARACSVAVVVAATTNGSP
jgi:glycogen operon protein